MYLVASVRPSVCPSVRLGVPRAHYGSRSKVEVKVMGQGQRWRSTFWRAAVDIRGSALPSAVKSNRSHYQSKVFVCVSVIIWRMRIIALMRSIGF